MKKILLSIIIGILSLNLTFAEKVEDIFNDVNSDYLYLEELQNLYDKNMIFPDSDGNLNPQRLLKRDEFVGVSMEVSCSKCINPYASFDLRQNYLDTIPFFDLEKNNKFFYCIADAEERSIVSGYNSGYVCDDGTTKEGESPFCVNNNIKLEEALAVLVRNSGLLTVEENNLIKADIINGKITDCLSDDVCPFNDDGSVYTFYGYFKKALEFEYKGITTSGDEVTYNIININSQNKLNPSKNITREEFIKMANVISLSTPCNNESKEMDFGLDMDYQTNNGVYDFDSIYAGTCESGVKTYRWDFYNTDTFEIETRFGKEVDNYSFLSSGKWIISLSVEDNCGKKGTVKNEIIVGDDVFELGINAEPVIGIGPLNVSFKSIVKGCDSSCLYSWNFSDGNNSNLENPLNYFTDNGVYKVILSVERSDGKKLSSDILINVLEEGTSFDLSLIDSDGDGIPDSEDNCPNEGGIVYQVSSGLKGCNIPCTSNANCSNFPGTACYRTGEGNGICAPDSDSDGVVDSLDKCINIYGEVTNEGCPILLENCNNSCECKTGFSCSLNSGDVSPFSCSREGLCIPDNSCSTNNDCSDGFVCSGSTGNNDGECIAESNCFGDLSGSYIFGNAVCDTCPCQNYLDFNSSLRNCDLIFPAITSPDGKEIYSRGKVWQIGKGYVE